MYDAFQFKGDTLKWDVKIILELTKDSWKKTDKLLSDTILKHEQGHFEIGRICAAEAHERVKATVFLKTNDYREKLRLLITGIVDKYKLSTSSMMWKQTMAPKGSNNGNGMLSFSMN